MSIPTFNGSVAAGAQGSSGDTVDVVDVYSNKNSTTTKGNSATTAVFGQSVTFTANVTSPDGTPTGQVNFLDGLNLIGTGDLNNGTATYSTSSLTTGTHNITETYSGDSDFAPSTTTAAISETITPASTTTTGTTNATVAVFGQPIILSGSVSAVTPGSGIPTGKITFMEGSKGLPENKIYKSST